MNDLTELKANLEAEINRLYALERLYESASEIITTPAGKVWIAAEKHEAVVDRLREALEKIADLGQEHSGGAVTDYENIAREALDRKIKP